MGRRCFRPLSLKVPSGEYPVEVAATGRNAAVRIVFASDREAIVWKPAATVEEGDHFVGVDGGIVAFFDAEAFMSLDSRDQIRLGDPSNGIEPEIPMPGVHFVCLDDRTDAAPNGVIVNSGYGDGCYPCYWGFDSDGGLVSLVADFWVLVEHLPETVAIDWSSAQLGQEIDHPLLKEFDLRVSLHAEGRDGTGIKAIGERFGKGRLLDRSGRLICDTESGGIQVAGDEHFYYSGANLKEVSDAKLELTIWTGYRNSLSSQANPSLAEGGANAVAKAHTESLLRFDFDKAASSYATEVTLMPGHELLKPKYGLAGDEGRNATRKVDRTELLDAIGKASEGSPERPAEEIERILEVLAFERMEATPGDFPVKPPEHFSGPEAELRFAIEKGDVLLKMEAGSILYHLREIDGEWKVISEYLR